MRVLRIQIAYGFHSEAKLDAQIFANLSGDDEVLTFFHAVEGERSQASAFARAAGCQMTTVDTGWRNSRGKPRTVSQKAASLFHLALALPGMVWRAYQWHPDVVDSTQQTWDCLVAFVLSTLLRKPQIIHLWYPVGEWLGFISRYRLKTCEAVVVPSKFMADCAIRHGVKPDRICLIYGTLTLPEPQPVGTREAVLAELSIPPDSVVAGIVARVETWKGQLDTLRAFRRIQDRCPQAHLLIVGDGAALGAVRKEVRSGHGQERIHILGYRSDVPRLLSAIDVFCHPSREEAFGLAVAEASARSIPVLAYADGAACELVLDGVTGLLAAPGDVEGLADRMERLVADRGYRIKLGTAGRDRMKELFRPELAGRAYGRLLRRMAPTGRVGSNLDPRAMS